MELPRAAERNDMKGFHSGLKEVWGPKKKGHFHLKSKDGMETFSDSKKVVARWSEHVQKLSTLHFNMGETSRCPQVPPTSFSSATLTRGSGFLLTTHVQMHVKHLI